MKYIFWLLFIISILFIFTSKVSISHAVGTDLFISEYVEGTSYNKALEIYNPTENLISLDGYKLQSYVGGTTTPNYTLLFTSGSNILPGGLYVICNSSTTTLLSKCNQTSGGVMTFTGDDALVLAKTDGTPVDVIGQIGTDPGTEWGVDLLSTMDNTLIRKSNIEMGDVNGNDAFDPSKEWDGFATDYFDNLGMYNLLTPGPTTTPTAYATPTPSPTPEQSPTSNPTFTPTPSITASPTTEPTIEPTESSTPTPTPVVTILPTESPTSSPTPTFTPEPTDIPEPSISSTPTQTFTPTASPTSAPHHHFDYWVRHVAKNCGKYVKNFVKSHHKESLRHHKYSWPSPHKYTKFNHK